MMRINGTRLVAGIAAILLSVSTVCEAWQSPKARDIAVATNGFNYPAMGTSVQSAIAWFDDNVITVADGVVDTASLNTRLSITSTQSFGSLTLLNTSNSNTYMRVGSFYGFKASLTNGSTFHVLTNSLAYVKVLTETNWYNPQGWYAGATDSKFTPLAPGYYWLGAEVLGTSNCQFRIVSSDASNQTVYVGSTSHSNNFVSGGGIVYALGTAAQSFWLEGLPTLGATSAPVIRAVFQGHYLGGN